MRSSPSYPSLKKGFSLLLTTLILSNSLTLWARDSNDNQFFNSGNRGPQGPGFSADALQRQMQQSRLQAQQFNTFKPQNLTQVAVLPRPSLNFTPQLNVPTSRPAVNSPVTVYKP